MKSVTKLMMGAAMLAGAAGAAQAANVPQPSTDNSDLMFFVSDTAAGSTYTVALSQTLNGPGGYFTTADGATTPFTNGVVNTINGDTAFSYSFGAGSPLQSFISTADGKGDAGALVWGVIGGAFSGTAQSANRVPGATLFVGTSAVSPIGKVTESTLSSNAPTTIDSDINGFNANTLDAFNGSTNGIFGTTSSANGTTLNLENIGVDESGVVIGSTAFNLYGFTGNNSNGGQGRSFLLGTASFDGTTLNFTGEGGGGTAVPLPAAAWLFGSGLLGLLGIGRRRDGVVAAA